MNFSLRMLQQLHSKIPTKGQIGRRRINAIFNDVIVSRTRTMANSNIGSARKYHHGSYTQTYHRTKSEAMRGDHETGHQTRCHKQPSSVRFITYCFFSSSFNLCRRIERKIYLIPYFDRF